MNNSNNKYEQLLALIKAAVEKDNMLRSEYQIGERFRFVRDRLETLQGDIAEQLDILRKSEERKTSQQADDEMVVYVYLFNVQGILLPTWQKMLTPSVFYEYSVNRPIYADKSQIEAFIRSKANKAQHAYVAVHAKKVDVSMAGAKDAIGGDLVRVKEGGLKFTQFVSFHYAGHEYHLNALGELIKAV